MDILLAYFVCIVSVLTPTKADGEWGKWSIFGPCYQHGHDGYKTRSRACDHPPCYGDVVQTEECTPEDCRVRVVEITEGSCQTKRMSKLTKQECITGPYPEVYSGQKVRFPHYAVPPFVHKKSIVNVADEPAGCYFEWNNKITTVINLYFNVYFNLYLNVNAGDAGDADCTKDKPCFCKKRDAYMEHVGCFKESTEDRAMPILILDDRTSGQTIDWWNYKEYLLGFASRCAEKAAEKGYTMIGLQYYGECWSGPRAEKSYNMHGESTECINFKLKPYLKNNPACVRNMGNQWANYVYRISEKYEDIESTWME